MAILKEHSNEKYFFRPAFTRETIICSDQIITKIHPLSEIQQTANNDLKAVKFSFIVPSVPSHHESSQKIIEVKLGVGWIALNEQQPVHPPLFFASLSG